jgi:hypothetical protein
MEDYRVTAFKHGVVDSIEDQSIPDGAASDALNWLTQGDKIELRRGSRVIGTEIAGTGRVTGIHTAFKADGTEVYYRARGKKVEYTTNAVDGPWTELGSDILGTAADGENVFFANYSTNAGAMMFFSSPNSSLFKVMVANPGSYTDLYDSTKNFKGLIAIHQNRMLLWQRTTDITAPYGSYIDTATYTTVSAEATTSLSGTLAFKAAGPKRTCFGVAITITASGEVYTDNYNGVLTGSLGGTGTINYTTGEYTLSNAGVGTADYQWENSNAAGITDFSKSTPRTAGQGFVFRQDDGGSKLMNILPIGDTLFCLHEHRSWALTLTATDTAASNDIFRVNVGIPSPRAAIAAGDGIYFIDTTDPANPQFKKLYPSGASGNIVPSVVTENVDLTGYIFDDCCMEEWGDYITFTGRASDSTVNNRLFAFHKRWKSIDILDYYVSCTTKANGTLIAGESISNNVITLFSGFDDSDSLINNYWAGNNSNLKRPGNLKKVKRLWIEGEIQEAQSFDVYQENDRGGMALVGTVDGSESYVDTSQSVLVGTHTVGSKEVGGGASTVEAYHYHAPIHLRLDKFMDRKLKFVARGIGYASISAITDHDIRTHEAKLPRKYRS